MVLLLDYDEVVAIYTDLMHRLGLLPPPVIREGDLRSAVSRPGWAAEYEGLDLLGQASRLATGIARAHGFLDGNKRTAHRALTVVLALNGLRVTGERLDQARLIERLAGAAVDRSEADAVLERFLRERVEPRQ